MADIEQPAAAGAVRWIDSDAELQRACADWQQRPVLALDTEFVRRTTFYPIPALLQCFDGVAVSVLDPLAISDWQPLVTLLRDPSVCKVMHACSEDLEVFWRLLGMLPEPLFDTQIAAGFCGMRPGMAYRKLVAELLQRDLPKDQTNSDWLVRPLAAEQLRYAADDVFYLFAVYQELIARAQQLGRVDWVLQESAVVGRALPTLLAPESSYLRLKGAWRMTRRELAVARALCAWREQQARLLDRPRNWIMKDAVVVELAQRQPTQLSALGDVDGLMAATVRKQGEQLLQLVQQARALPEREWPAALPNPNGPSLRAPLALLQRGVKACAKELAIEPELILSRRQQDAVLANWVNSGAPEAVLPDSCNSPWRAALLQATLRQMERA